MSDIQEIADLRRQKSELEARTSAASAESDTVAMMNYQSRLDVVCELLEAAQSRDALTAEVSVLFDGRPVTGTSAIDAGFAAQALLNFQGIVTQLFAASSVGQAGRKKKIRITDHTQLNLKSLATGSFGFVLEEKNAQQANVMKTPLRNVMEEAANIIQDLSQAGDSDFLADEEKISPPVFKEIAKFFSHLEKNDATLKANFPDKTYSFDREAISRGYSRISDRKVKITREVWTGTLVGLSPIKRTFEFRKRGAGDIISGKFSRQISQDYLERIESSDGVTLGDTFKATIEKSTLRKPDGTITVSHTVIDLIDLTE